MNFKYLDGKKYLGTIFSNLYAEINIEEMECSKFKKVIFKYSDEKKYLGTIFSNLYDVFATLLEILFRLSLH